MLRGKLLDRRHRWIDLSQSLLSERADSNQTGLLLALHVGFNIFCVSELDLGAELKKARGKMVLGGQGAGVKVGNFLVLALMEKIEDVDELAFC
jgi:hypothetical protein